MGSKRISLKGCPFYQRGVRSPDKGALSYYRIDAELIKGWWGMGRSRDLPS
ncbi:hypothetical protein VCR4J5_800024 [Vibrio crassostreae]|uniref:Uncharacterized protein n=1 Tax=Vibrio crassostreae TaxID=246167 RepID=A0A822MNB6_9VIBR|nr:hypothetical protein VCR20J5_1030011 [Vibrio crassostreae]CDS99281.1 hypothetical protein VCR5J5_1340021 [Vibrio crassostreae]CDT04533.1 hypothetical protein VCR15J5_30010 [Vibrio crassostreae]CDT44979.1 hypothetical protein VCR19J5_530022 [Vibrio crassostreae]CDT48574.1 hypothetical protein VCR9J2_720022 [Vibrio crassostreae]